jgi:hypothetical protein
MRLGRSQTYRMKRLQFRAKNLTDKAKRQVRGLRFSVLDALS